MIVKLAAREHTAPPAVEQNIVSVMFSYAWPALFMLGAGTAPVHNATVLPFQATPAGPGATKQEVAALKAKGYPVMSVKQYAKLRRSKPQP